MYSSTVWRRAGVSSYCVLTQTQCLLQKIWGSQSNGGLVCVRAAIGVVSQYIHVPNQRPSRERYLIHLTLQAVAILRSAAAHTDGSLKDEWISVNGRHELWACWSLSVVSSLQEKQHSETKTATDSEDFSLNVVCMLFDVPPLKIHLWLPSFGLLGSCDCDCFMLSLWSHNPELFSSESRKSGRELDVCVRDRWPRLLLCFSYLNLNAGTPQMIYNPTIKMMA